MAQYLTEKGKLERKWQQNRGQETHYYMRAKEKSYKKCVGFLRSSPWMQLESAQSHSCSKILECLWVCFEVLVHTHTDTPPSINLPPPLFSTKLGSVFGITEHCWRPFFNSLTHQSLTVALQKTPTYLLEDKQTRNLWYSSKNSCFMGQSPTL